MSRGFGDHPIGQARHQCSLFGDPDEFGGRHQAELRMVPAEQCFDANAVAAVEVDLRLVLEKQLSALVEGARQISQQQEAAARFGIALRVELRPVAMSLRGVQCCGLSLVQSDPARFGAAFELCYPHARLRLDRHAVAVDRFPRRIDKRP